MNNFAVYIIPSSKRRGVNCYIHFGSLVFSVPFKICMKYFNTIDDDLINSLEYIPFRYKFYSDYLGIMKNLFKLVDKYKLDLYNQEKPFDRFYYYENSKRYSILYKDMNIDEYLLNNLDNYRIFDNYEKAMKDYKKRALASFKRRANMIAKEMGIDFEFKVKLLHTNTLSRLGFNSSSRKVVAFHPYLFAFSEEVGNSVIYHELSHFFEFNHSKKFYEVLFKYCPKYKEYSNIIMKGEFRYDDN